MMSLSKVSHSPISKGISPRQALRYESEAPVRKRVAAAAAAAVEREIWRF